MSTSPLVVRGDDYLPVALRAYTEAVSKERKRRRGESAARENRFVIVLDTETTVDRAQRLLFGSYRFYEARPDTAGGVALVCVDEGIFHDDELPQRDPDAYETLFDYARWHDPAVDPTVPDAGISIRLLSAREFTKVLHDAAYELQALVVCFNFPFDASRLATSWGEARSERFAGGFSLALHDYEHAEGTRSENRFRPRVAIKTIDSKRAIKGFTSPAEIDAENLTRDGRAFRGHLLDLRTPAFALTDRGHTLESACEAFGVPYTKQDVEHGRITPEYIDYNREDVEATARLYQAISAEYRRHPIDLQITKAYSPASIGKAYLRAMGIKPILARQPDFPKHVLGKAMVAYYGGRAECRIRRVPVPVVYCDFLSMYPTVNALMGLWEYVTARRIDVEDATEEIRALVEQVGIEDCLKPVTWRKFPALVEIEPDRDVLPVRARYGDGRSWGIGSNPVSCREAIWYALPDVIAAQLITGRAPRIRRALRFMPIGRQRGLKPIRLRGEVQIDPRERDLFQAVIEERHRLPPEEARTPEQERLHGFLKVFANATSYGIYAEMNRREQTGERQQDVAVYGLDDRPFPASVAAPEQPGVFAFPPMAACITAAARLMLAVLERLVTDRGGAYAFCDTDSMAIVGTEQGELIPCPGGPDRDEHDTACVRALSWAQVDEIARRFEALNPYDPGIVAGSVLETEDENYELDPGDPKRKRVLKDKRQQLYCDSIAAKRYALFNLTPNGEPALRKCSEHGLGHLLDPTVRDPHRSPIDPITKSRTLIKQVWEDIIRTDVLGQPPAEHDWLDRPAITRSTISTPRLLRPFERYNHTRSAADQIRPYNFMLVAHVAPFGHPISADPERFLLVAPYTPDPRQWRKLTWTNAYEPSSRYKITTSGQASENTVRVKSYRDVLAEYRIHPEAKSLGPDGQPCDRQTVGLLARRPVKVSTITYIGKESNRLEDAQAGLVTDLGDVLSEYPDPNRDPFDRLVRPVLRELPVVKTAASANTSERTVKAVRAGTTRPRSSTRESLTAIAAEHTRERLRAAGADSPRDDLAAIAAYRELCPAGHAVQCKGCGAPLMRKQRLWCSDTCRKQSTAGA